MVLQVIKDTALAAALKGYLNEKFSAYGQIQGCSLDTARGRLVLDALLKGEREPIKATLEHFELVREGGKPFMVLHEFSSSRQWLGLLLTKLFTGKKYPLPTACAALL